MLLFAGRIVAFVGLLLLLSFFTNPAAAWWRVELFEGTQCGADGQTRWGEGGGCISQGGNSWEVEVEDPGADGCWFSSWSGVDCRGSSTPPFQNSGCQRVPFGSIKVDCD